MISTTVAFDLDDGSDLNDAGTSRYGDHLAHHQHLFRDGAAPTTDEAAFALMAWQVAGPSLMTPSYVRAHPRVVATAATWDSEDRPGVTVHLALPATALADRLTRHGPGWVRERYATRWPDQNDNSRTSIHASLMVNIPIARDLLPAPRYQLGIPDPATAKGALRVLCALLNAELAGVLAELDGVEVTR